MRLPPLRPALRASLRDASRITPVGGRCGSSSDTAAAWTDRFTPRTLLRRPVESGQYTSDAFQQVLDDHRVLGSIGSVGDAYDKALAS